MMRLDPDRVRRAWTHRWGLVAEHADPQSVAAGLFALHATDPATLVLSTWARLPRGPVQSAVEALTRALEIDRTLVRVMAMRRTVHVVRIEDLAAIRAVYAARLGPPLRRQVEQILVLAGVCTDEERTDRFDLLADEVSRALRGRDMTLTALSAEIPALAARFDVAQGKAYAAALPVGRYLIEAIGTRGDVVRARLQGGWRTNTCSWARVEDWLPAHAPLPPVQEAVRHLVRSYVGAFGPATLDDAAWWLGLPKGQVRTAVADLGEDVIELEVGDWPGRRFVLRDGLDLLQRDWRPVGTVLLPSLDPSVMGVQDRRPFLDPALTMFWDRSGNPAPTIWFDGRVVGGWAQTKSGEVRWRLVADAPQDEVGAAATQLADALAGERVAPRFPTPISKELAG